MRLRSSVTCQRSLVYWVARTEKQTHAHSVSGELGPHILSRSLTRPNMAAGDWQMDMRSHRAKNHMSEPGSQSLQDVGKGLFLGSHLLNVLAGLFSLHRLASFNEIFSFARMHRAMATSAIPLSLFSAHVYEASLHVPHLNSTFPRQTWQDFAYTVESVKAEFTEAEGRMVVTRWGEWRDAGQRAQRFSAVAWISSQDLMHGMVTVVNCTASRHLNLLRGYI